MTRFELRTVSASRDIALLINDDSGSSRLVHVYGEQEQYPLGTDRYYRNLPNLFLDVIDLLDGNDPLIDEESAGSDPDAIKGNAISLKTLTQRAAHAAADGSGNARRFKDARSLWALMTNHVETRVRRPDDDPIVDVRRTKNWKKNQPMRAVPADPDAWFVTGVYSRSNQMRDPLAVYRGLDALFATMLSELDETAAPNLVHARDAVRVNLDYPTYAEVAAILDDSNMLVFHNDQSLADWIRTQSKEQEAIHAETPVQVHVIPDPVLDEDDPRYLPADSTMTAAHLANVIAPRE
ncbi:hypothetical protein [Bifidobacterium simiarum]|uniref:Uncharacterized protein n=1 Tax=Bifidobacterium simiarum TaxID=2045441 RepID=A0A2M9HCZ5_9BIFI|nr:hypothetical protein [Bifidobacterium simiarum]MBT1167232.1 hypothetical protein [Bifidobacterium simiarum]PJM74688.1 hypothetical protein CSQ87_09150 [Bifidobacterium simiarum]